MVKSKKAVVLFVLSGILSGLNASSASIYTDTCAACHGKNGQGNTKVPDAPELNKLSKDDLVAKLSDIKDGGIINDHEKMTKNQKVLERCGVKYDSLEMADYIIHLNEKK
jgi:cytochrome c553